MPLEDQLGGQANQPQEEGNQDQEEEASERPAKRHKVEAAGEAQAGDAMQGVEGAEGEEGEGAGEGAEAGGSKGKGAGKGQKKGSGPRGRSGLNRAAAVAAAAADSKPATAGDAGPWRRVFDLTNETQLDAYWERLEYIYTSRNIDIQQLRHCFPGTGGCYGTWMHSNMHSSMHSSMHSTHECMALFACPYSHDSVHWSLKTN